MLNDPTPHATLTIGDDSWEVSFADLTARHVGLCRQAFGVTPRQLWPIFQNEQADIVEVVALIFLARLQEGEKPEDIDIDRLLDSVKLGDEIKVLLRDDVAPEDIPDADPKA